MEWMFSTEIWVALLTLATLEIVLGIDNLVFISIAVSKLPPHQREVARKFGIAVACITRIGLLLTLAFLAKMQKNLSIPTRIVTHCLLMDFQLKIMKVSKVLGS